MPLNSTSRPWASSAARASGGRAPGRQQREPGVQPRDCSAACSLSSLLKLIRKPVVPAGPARGLCAGGFCCSGVCHILGAPRSPPEPCSSLGSSVPAHCSHCSHKVPWSTPCTSCVAFHHLLFENKRERSSGPSPDLGLQHFKISPSLAWLDLKDLYIGKMASSNSFQIEQECGSFPVSPLWPCWQHCTCRKAGRGP